MGIAVLVLGESGSGKTSSLRNFSESQLGIINVAKKPLPFKKKFQLLNTDNYDLINKKLTEGVKKSYAIDDAQYLMAFELFNRAKEKGYERFIDIACHFRNLLETINHKIDTKKIVYILQHIDVSDTGRIKPKTMGKMLDEKLNIAGLCSIVLMCRTDGKQYRIETKTDGFTPCKTPMGMFNDSYIDNDLTIVDKKIREYYEL